MSTNQFAVALVHHPIVNRQGETSTTAITSTDIHDFARTCAMFDVAPVYIVHPAEGMHSLVHDITAHWLEGEGGKRNPGRKQVLEHVRLARDFPEVLEHADAQVWYTSATPPAEDTVSVEKLAEIPGKHLIVFGTGWGLDYRHLPQPTGWLSPIAGIGMVRHLSVWAALSIYLDRLRFPR